MLLNWLEIINRVSVGVGVGWYIYILAPRHIRKSFYFRAWGVIYLPSFKSFTFLF